MRLLAIDTALDACAVALLEERDGVRRLVEETDVIGRGHAERLMAVVETVLSRAEVDLAEIDVFAVSVGPGSFTGIRVGVAAVRGFALATGRPAVSVGSLEALAREARRQAPGRAVLAVLDARKDEVYAQGFDPAGAPFGPPVVEARAAAAARAAARDAVLIGSGAPLLAALGPDLVVVSAATFPAIATIAEIAAERWAEGGDLAPPSPLYVRAPDAKPQAGSRLARLTPADFAPLATEASS